MREIFLADLKNIQYGIWKDEIVSVRELDALHRIPMIPACIAGILIENGQTVTLANLPVCIGYDSSQKITHGCILLKEYENKTIGFVVSGELRTLPISPELVFPLPDYLRTPIFDSCAVHNGIPIPLININELHTKALNSGNELSDDTLWISAVQPQEIFATGQIKLLTLNGERFAVSADSVEDVTTTPGTITPLPNTPRYVKGVAFWNGRLLTIIDLSQRLKLQSVLAGSTMLVAKIGGDKFGFLYESDGGNLPTRTISIKPAPPIIHTPWLKHVVSHTGELVPLIDLGMVLPPASGTRNELSADRRYTINSKFPDHFFKHTVDVTVFTILGEYYALPKMELEDIIPIISCRAIPDAPPIVIGIAEHNGEILPVLDLAMMFGRRSITTPSWRMLLVSNGDFRALVVTEFVSGEKQLPIEIHRPIPIHLPHNLVYGCYPDGTAARVILNIEAIVVHFDKSLIQSFMPALSSGMKTSPTGELYTFPNEFIGDTLPPAETFDPEPAINSPSPPASDTSPKDKLEEHATLFLPGKDPLPDKTSDQEYTKSVAFTSNNAAPINSSVSSAKQVSEPNIIIRVSSNEQSSEKIRPIVEPEITPDKIGHPDKFAIVPSAELSEDYRETRDTSAHNIPSVKLEHQALPPSSDNSAQLTSHSTQRPAGMEPSSNEVPKREPIQSSASSSNKFSVSGATHTPATKPLDLAISGNKIANRESSDKEKKTLEPPAKHTEIGSSKNLATVMAETSPLEHDTVQASERSRVSAKSANTGNIRQNQHIENQIIKPAQDEHVTGKRHHKLAYGAIATILIGSLFYFMIIADKPGTEISAQERAPEKMTANIAKSIPGKLEPESSGSKARLPNKSIGAPVNPETSLRTTSVPARVTSLAHDKSAPAAVAIVAPLEFDVPASIPINTDIYIVVRGDTLWNISARFTGNPFNYPRIAGKNEIANPDLIFPGQRISLIRK